MSTTTSTAKISCPPWCVMTSPAFACQGEHFRDIGSVKASGAEVTRRVKDPDDFPQVNVTVGFCQHPNETPDDAPYVTVGIWDDQIEGDVPLRAGEVRNLITMLQVALATIEEPTAEQKVEEARKVVAELLAKHGITDKRQAKRLVRERFSEDELHQWRRALRALDGNGAIG